MIRSVLAVALYSIGKDRATHAVGYFYDMMVAGVGMLQHAATQPWHAKACPT
jgi:hypothetical protein